MVRNVGHLHCIQLQPRAENEKMELAKTYQDLFHVSTIVNFQKDLHAKHKSDQDRERQSACKDDRQPSNLPCPPLPWRKESLLFSCHRVRHNRIALERGSSGLRFGDIADAPDKSQFLFAPLPAFDVENGPYEDTGAVKCREGSSKELDNDAEGGGEDEPDKVVFEVLEIEGDLFAKVVSDLSKVRLVDQPFH